MAPVYSWPNPFYQEEADRATCAPSQVFLASGITIPSEDSAVLNFSVPCDQPPEYPAVSPTPPSLLLELVLLVPLHSNAISNSEEVQAILDQI